MAVSIQPITKRAIIFSIIASILIWLPFINTMADNRGPVDFRSLLLTTILANFGILALIWLQWFVRRKL